MPVSRESDNIYEPRARRKKEYYIDASVNSAFFIIADDPSELIDRYMNCTMDCFADK